MWKYKGIRFDDATMKVEDDLNDWSQICPDCVKKYNIPESMLDDGGSGICGVEGCENDIDKESDKTSMYYIDFPEGELIEITE
jgi:hypothetical protein